MKLKSFLLAAVAVGILMAAGQTQAASEQAHQAYLLLDSANSFYCKLEAPIEITWKDAAGKGDKQQFTSKLAGVILDKKNSTSTDNAFMMDLNYQGKEFEAYTGENKLNIGIESKIKRKDGNFFFRLNTYPDVIDDYQDISALRGKWMKFPLGEAASTGEMIDPTGLFSKTMSVADASTVTPEDSQARKKQMENAFFASSALQVVSSEDGMMTDGAAGAKTIIKIDKMGLMQYALQTSKILGQPMTKDEIKDMQTEIGRMTFEDIELIANSGAVQIDWDMSYSSPTVDYKIGLKMLVKNINDPKLKVEAPAGALSAEEVMALLQGVGNLGEARVNARDARTVSDVIQIMTAAEMYYNEAGDYPKTITIGKPIAYGANTYMAKVPAAPVQEKEDPCYQQQYKYKYIKNSDYTLQYCVNGETGYVPAGINVASPSGFYDETKTKTIAASTKMLNTRLAAAEKTAFARRPNVEKSGNNVRLSLQTTKEVAFIEEALSSYKTLTGQYPASLTAGKSLTAKGVTLIKKMPTALQYKDAKACKNAKYEYKPIIENGKAVDYQLRYCAEKVMSMFSDGDNSGWYVNTSSGSEKELSQGEKVNKELSAKNVSNVKQIMIALEMYYNEEGGYPEKITVGQPIKYGTNIYMAKVPAAVKYNNPKKCSSNSYVYKPLRQKAASDCASGKKCYESYTLDYCNETDAGSIPAGNSQAGPAGIMYGGADQPILILRGN
ncbi:MAG: hypothetical protein WCO55_04910 [Candidatus Falkowbacteria bacterium]